MPGPPPPPPPMAPPTTFTSSKRGSDDRSALLKSIRSGTKLKKTVTNDKSAPLIAGKISNNNTNNSECSGGSQNNSLAPTQNGLNLGGLFAGGMPKLRATGKLGGVSNFSNNYNNNNNGDVRRKPDILSQPLRNLSSVQNELKKQMASDNKNRGPPPPAPTRNVVDDSPISRQLFAPKSTHLNGFRANLSSLHANQSGGTLHRKAKSNANLSAMDHTDSPIPEKPVINHGKPNLAPKPPTLNGKPAAPPKKLMINGKPVSRAQSMKSPRSPSPQSPDSPAIKFGTVRNLSSVIGQSLAHSTGNLSPRPRPMLNGRPSAPPPSIPSQPLPPSKTSVVRPPNHAPPPPPPLGTIPQPPNHAPPPPPHRTQPMRAPPAVPNTINNNSNNYAPPPPPRHSSMKEAGHHTRRGVVDFDERFKHMFHHWTTFPKPPPYRHVLKLYTNRQAGGKQQAPQPPHLQATSKTWDTSSTC